MVYHVHVHRFCDELKCTGHAQLLTPYLPHYIEHLSAMAGDFPEEVICLVVDALQLVIQVCLEWDYGNSINNE